MSITIPSKLISSIDIPEVKNLYVNFVYNYFTPDEIINENSKIPDFLAKKSTGEINSSYQKIFDSTVPRYMRISWEKVNATINSKLSTGGGSSFENLPSNYVATNYFQQKIIGEDYFSSNNFVGISFQNGRMFDKIGLMTKASLYAFGEIPESNPIHDLITNDPSFHSTTYEKTGTQSEFSSSGKDIREILDSVTLGVKINKTLLYQMSVNLISDPNSPYDDNAYEILKTGQKFKDVEENTFDQSNYQQIIPYVDVKTLGKDVSYYTETKVVGYIIYKHYVDENEKVVTCPPIIIEGNSSTLYYDRNVKYNKTYCYNICTVCALKIPAINKISGEVSLITVLISSKPSQQIWVASKENKPPPYPADIKYIWEYKDEKLSIHWNLPVNTQYDIKKFQVFRRSSIHYPFQLIKQYDFDDSAVKIEDGENPDISLVENVNFPKKFYIDTDFTKDSKFIYTLACIDAHGLTSNYGPQMEVSFDRFKNKLVTKQIGYPGAPKPYPNLYLDGTGFSNVMKVGGRHSKKMSIYLAPHEGKRYYSVYNGFDATNERVFETDMTNGYYKLQIINLDNQKGETITIQVNDKITKKNQS